MTDYHLSTSPRPQRLPRRVLTRCGSATERRIQAILTWHAGDCGLIETQACEAIGEMYFAGVVSLGDIKRLAAPGVYHAIVF